MSFFKKIILIGIFVGIIPLSVKCQINKNLNSKWVKATISLKVFYRATFGEEKVLLDSFNKGKISEKKLDSLLDSKVKAGVGSAVFLKIGSSHYLLTAKHMITRFWDTDTAHRVNTIVIVPRPYDSIQDFKTAESFIENGKSKVTLPSGVSVTMNDGSPVPSFTFHNGGLNFSIEFYAFNRARAIKNQHYYITPPGGGDVALINIDRFGGQGKNLLLTFRRWGYRPIEMTDFFNDDTISEGQRLFCIGFPRESILNYLNQPTLLDQYIKSDLLAYPMVTKGFSELTDFKSTNFEAAIFTYHGFSGGPIIFNNKLIGITSGAEWPTSPDKKELLYKAQFLSYKSILTAIKIFTSGETSK